MDDKWHDKSHRDSKIEGEGSYSGTKAYNDSTAEFVKKDKVDKAAQEAKRALDSKEGAELTAAEAKGKAGDPRHMDTRHMDTRHMDTRHTDKAASRPK